MALESRDKSEAYINQFKWSVVAHDPSLGDKLFPDLFDSDEVIEDVDLDSIEGDIEFVSDGEDKNMTPEAMQALLQQFNQ